MREIYGRAEPLDPGPCFYTITLADLGKAVIETEAGPIGIGVIMGRVKLGDVGKRLIRVSVGGGLYIWQVESDRQLQARRARA